MERKTRFTHLRLLSDKSAQRKAESVFESLGIYPYRFRRTITTDNGAENKTGITTTLLNDWERLCTSAIPTTVGKRHCRKHCGQSSPISPQREISRYGEQ